MDFQKKKKKASVLTKPLVVMTTPLTMSNEHCKNHPLGIKKKKKKSYTPEKKLQDKWRKITCLQIKAYNA